ncbi:MAG: 23S rRNA (adenine(2030)-N(6))-methyltransferase RlmJ [Alphaproteobacteria bacterium]|nr:23S rRNA (adenine(2030)-N(6))-methyltransferase RlmJ [Alphaproteobacteria bacterium]
MNYRHAYHAGSVHDLFKHLVWLHLIGRFQQKPTPFLLVDGYAGSGLYDLEGGEARSTAEAETGISSLLRLATVPRELQPLLALVRAQNLAGAGRFYPGSTLIAAVTKRESDRLVACELQPEEAAKLRSRVKELLRIHHLRHITVLAEDGLAALKSLLPPPEKRALILLDPPYERDDEYDRLARAICDAYGRFPTGCFVLWYPLKDSLTTSRSALLRFCGELQNQGVRRIQLVDFSPAARDEAGKLNGSGMMLINPPWQVEEEILAICRSLAAALGLSQARFAMREVVGE